MTIKQLLLDRISQVETIEETQLSEKETYFLVRFLLSFTERTIQKFVKGHKEHSETDFFTDVEPTSELENELIDAQIYLALLQYKLAEKDNERHYRSDESNVPGV